jgi:glycosyltransferase involved in cell wall biosynthesis
MTMGDFVSIVVPAFNAERFVAQSIESVRGQTHPKWELLIIIDAKSTDGTERIARQYSKSDSRIRVISGGTRGVAANRNLGISTASGQYVCFLDSDDWWHPEKLARQLTFVRETQAPFSFTAYDVMSQNGMSVKSSVQAEPRIAYDDLLNGSRIGCLTVMIRLNAFQDVLFRDENHEDFCLWLRLLRTGAIASGSNERLAYYRRVRGSRSNNKFLSASWRWKIYRCQENLGLLASARHLGKYLIRSGFNR